MPTFKEAMDALDNHNKAFSKNISESHAATDHFINNSFTQADELIKAGKHQEGADILSKMMDGMQAQQKTRWEQIARNSETVNKMSYQPSQAASSGASKFKLPEGISKGKIAAIAAGVAVVGGGILLYRNHQQKKRESWAMRIEQERMTQRQNNFRGNAL